MTYSIDATLANGILTKRQSRLRRELRRTVSKKEILDALVYILRDEATYAAVKITLREYGGAN